MHKCPSYFGVVLFDYLQIGMGPFIHCAIRGNDNSAPFDFIRMTALEKGRTMLSSFSCICCLSKVI